MSVSVSVSVTVTGPVLLGSIPDPTPCPGRAGSLPWVWGPMEGGPWVDEHREKGNSHPYRSDREREEKRDEGRDRGKGRMSGRVGMLETSNGRERGKRKWSKNNDENESIIRNESEEGTEGKGVEKK